MLKVRSSSVFRVVPALSARIRFSPDRSQIGKPNVIASLDIETANYLETDLTITAVQMRMSDGHASDLSTENVMKLPLRCRSKDNLIFLFGLTPIEGVFGAFSTSRTLNITIDASVLVSKSYCAQIQMHWNTMVDFSAVLNPGHGLQQSIQRGKWPATSPATVSQSTVTDFTGTSHEMRAFSVSTKDEMVSSTDADISITFTAPREIWVGEPFQLDLSVINRSSKPRHLAITALPKRKPGDSKRHVSKASSSSLGGRKDTIIHEVVTDENALYATQRSAGPDSPRLIPLGHDLRIG